MILQKGSKPPISSWKEVLSYFSQLGAFYFFVRESNNLKYCENLLICNCAKETLKLVSRGRILVDSKSWIFNFRDFYMRLFPLKLMWTKTLLWLKSYTCCWNLCTAEKKPSRDQRLVLAKGLAGPRISFLQGKAWDFQVVPHCSPAIDLGGLDNANSFFSAFESEGNFDWR